MNNFKYVVYVHYLNNIPIYVGSGINERANSLHNRNKEHIKDMKKEEVSIKDIITSICYSFGSKKIKSIVEPLKEEMVKSELIFLKNKKGLFGNKQNIILNDEKFNNVINELR